MDSILNTNTTLPYQTIDGITPLPYIRNDGITTAGTSLTFTMPTVGYLKDATVSTVPAPKLSFNVSLYGNLEEIDDSKSKCRVRIFYRGLNRNRTYISEEFANQLIASLPYAPIKGIFDNDEVDFKDHGEKNSDGRIYGVVMSDPNFAWEDHMDADGVIRTYACADVLLYTALYQEAKLIPGSSQSMEINPYTYTGEWRTWEDGLPYYHFLSGSLFGLQALGTAVEPCFEGAAFYSYNHLAKDVEELISYIKNIDSNKNLNKKEEKSNMDEKILYRMSDREKADKICSALNPNFNEEGGWKFDFFLLDVYPDYALAVSYEDEKYYRVNYNINEDESITVGEKTEVVITDVTKDEFVALEALKAMGTYAEINEKYTSTLEEIATIKEEKENLNSQLEEVNKTVEEKATEIETLNNNLNEVKEELESLKAEKVSLENSISDLNKEKEALVEFKTSVETAQKKEILDKYSEYITPEKYSKFEEEIANYTVEDFEKEVCVSAVKNTPTIFSKEAPSQSLIYTGNTDDLPKGESALEVFIDKTIGGNK